MGNAGSHGRAPSASTSHVRWVPSEETGTCIVAHIRHPRGLPRGAARMLAQWVRHGSAAHPYPARVQDALTRQGSRLDHAVRADSTTFSLCTADWRWGLQFLLELLGTPVLSDDVYENIAMDYAEECQDFDLDEWLQRQRGWTSVPAATAAHLRGVWAHLYSFAYVRLAVGGRIPPRPPGDLSSWIGAVVARPPTFDMVPWQPPSAGCPPPPPLLPQYNLTQTPRPKTHEAAPQVVCLFVLPPHLPREQCEVLRFMMHALFQDKCRQCPSWAKSAACSVHVLGDADTYLALVLTFSSHDAVAQKMLPLKVDIMQTLRQHTISRQTTESAVHALRSRQTVDHLRPEARLLSRLLPRAARLDDENISTIHENICATHKTHLWSGPAALASVSVARHRAQK